MSLLVNKSIKEYADLLASKEPAPGGGSTAALVGVMGASLFLMVVNLSRGKKSYEALEEAMKASVEKEFEIMLGLKDDLTHLVDEDTIAFNRVMSAMKLPKETEEEKKVRNEKVQEASLYALQVPLKAAEKCFDILKNCKAIALYGNKNAASDSGVGAMLALSGLEGAALNVKINLPGIHNELIKADAQKKIEELIQKGKYLQKEILSIVNDRMV